jgi:hypothetical protein
VGAYILTSLPQQPAKDFAAQSKSMVPAAADAVARATDTTEADRATPDETLPLPAENVVVKGPNATGASADTQPNAEPLGSLSIPGPKLVLVAPPRALTLSVPACGSSDGRERFCAELLRGGPISVDLFCRDPARGFERLQAAFLSRGVKMFVDGVAQEAVKRKVRGRYLMYCEDLTAAEWGQVLQFLAASDKRTGEALFDVAVVTQPDPADMAEFGSLFGTDPTRPDGARNGGGGLATRPSVMKAVGKTALAGVISPLRTSPTSKEVRQFFDTRPGQPASAMAVILSLRAPLN